MVAGWQPTAHDKTFFKPENVFTYILTIYYIISKQIHILF
jgi:hypothetical protein